MRSSGPSAREGPTTTRGEARTPFSPVGCVPVQRPHVTGTVASETRVALARFEIGKDGKDWKYQNKLFEKAQ